MCKDAHQWGLTRTKSKMLDFQRNGTQETPAIYLEGWGFNFQLFLTWNKTELNDDEEYLAYY